MMQNKRFVITVTIQSNEEGATPVDITWYRGEDHVEALAALMQAGAKDIGDESMPVRMRAVVKAVRMDIYDLPACSNCGAVLVGEDCPNYGHGSEHAPMLDWLVDGHEIAAPSAQAAAEEAARLYDYEPTSVLRLVGGKR